jgi:hypothetical protein
VLAEVAAVVVVAAVLVAQRVELPISFFLQQLYYLRDYRDLEQTINEPHVQAHAAYYRERDKQAQTHLFSSTHHLLSAALPMKTCYIQTQQL